MANVKIKQRPWPSALNDGLGMKMFDYFIAIFTIHAFDVSNLFVIFSS